MSIHLIIPDAHVKAGQDLIRFNYLSQLILDLKPDKVICLGDLADLPSLHKNEKRDTLKNDLIATWDAQERLYSRLRRAKKKLPKFVFLIGNHEERLNKLDRLDELALEDYWDVIQDFLKPIVEDGVAYSHYFTQGMMGKSISGVNISSELLNTQFMSCTQGHTHRRDFAERARPDGKKILALSAGCFMNYVPDYAIHGASSWWSGVVIKNNVNEGNYDPQFVSLEMLEKEYHGYRYLF